MPEFTENRGEHLGIIIIGAGGHSKVVLDVVLSAGFEVLGFVDDRLELKGKEIHGRCVVGNLSWIEEHFEEIEGAIVAIGNNTIREKIYNQMCSMDLTLIFAVHSSAVVSRTVSIGNGTVIMPNATINIDTEIGENVIINTSASIDHDCVIEDHCHIAPGVRLAGGVRVGRGSFLGIGTVATPGVIIGENVTAGAGSVIIENVPDGVTVAGVPARVIRENII